MIFIGEGGLRARVVEGLVSINGSLINIGVGGASFPVVWGFIFYKW